MEKNSQSFLQSLPFVETRNEQTYFIELRFTQMLEKYKARHNGILETLANWINSKKSSDQRLLTDLNSFDPIEAIFDSSLRPDIVLYDNKNILVLELTVCHESNLLKSKQFKLRKYENISKLVKNKYKCIPISVFTIEVSVLGFISDIHPFLLAANLPELPNSVMSSVAWDAINSSFNIHRLRHAQ